MTMPLTGQISLDDARTEMQSSGQITLNDTAVRTMFARKSDSTTIGLADGYGKYHEPIPRSFVQFYSFIMNNYVISGYPNGGYLHKYIKIDKDTFTATDAGNLADLGNYTNPSFPTHSYQEPVWLSIPGSNTGLIFGASAWGSGNTFLIKVYPSGTSITTIKTGGSSDGTVYPRAAGYGPAGYIYSTARALFDGGQRYVNISQNLSSWSTTQVAYSLSDFVGTPNSYTAIGTPVGSNSILQSSSNGTDWISRIGLPGEQRTSGAYGASTIVYAQCYINSPTVNIFRSTDSGINWSSTTINLPENVNGNIGTPKMLYVGNGTFVLIVSAASNMFDRYICRSTNKGTSWTYAKYTNFVTGAAYSSNQEGFSTTDGNIVYVAGGSIKQSTDFGMTWVTKTIPQTFTPGRYGVGAFFPIF